MQREVIDDTRLTILYKQLKKLKSKNEVVDDMVNEYNLQKYENDFIQYVIYQRWRKGSYIKSTW